MDDLVSVVDPTNLTTSYQYNGLGDLLQLISPATGVTVNSFDSGGNLRSTVDARGLGGTYTYDALNRVTQVDYGDQSIIYSYDEGPNGRGRLTGASDALHSLSWQYDFFGRVVNKSLNIAGVTLSINYGYTNGRMTSLSTPSGQLISYSYANGRISGIGINGSVLLTNVLYEPFGPARSWTWANASAEIRLHDTDGNPSQISALESTTYSLDSAFRIVSASNASSPTASWNYGYDNLDHLISATSANTTLNLAYDGAGNRLSQQGASGPAYTATNFVLTYNNRGRLIGTSAGTYYVYDALGQRIERGGSTTTLYSYDEAGHLLGEYTGSGALKRLQNLERLGNTRSRGRPECFTVTSRDSFSAS